MLSEVTSLQSITQSRGNVYYRPANVEWSIHGTPTPIEFRNPTIANLFLDAIAKNDPRAIRNANENYWGAHSNEYRATIEGICAPLDIKMGHKDTLCVIPARNEPDILTGVTAAANGGCDLSHIVVVHNFSDVSGDTMQEQLDRLHQKYPQVNIVSLHLPDEFKIQDVKKITTDIGLMITKGVGNLLLLDADIVKITNKSVTSLGEDIDRAHPLTFYSAVYQCDPKLQNKFPGIYHYLNVVNMLANKFFGENETGAPDKILRGGFMFSRSVSYILGGGMPTEEDVLEDVAFSNVIYSLSARVDLPKPIRDIEDLSISVFVDPSREVVEMVGNPDVSPYDRWRQTYKSDGHNYTRQARRPWRTIQTQETRNIPICYSETNNIPKTLQIVLLDILRREANYMDEAEMDHIEWLGQIVSAYILYFKRLYVNQLTPKMLVETFIKAQDVLELDERIFAMGIGFLGLRAKKLGKYELLSFMDSVSREAALRNLLTVDMFRKEREGSNLNRVIRK